VKAYGWWYRNGDVVIAVCVVTAAIGLCIWATVVTGHPTSQLPHVYCQNYRAPFG
jgi:hypothetical protein